jgi:hypothetical protein
MTTYLKTIAVAFAFACAAGVGVRAQAPAQPARVAAQSRPSPVLIPLKVLVVVSRYQGEKKISSLPYTLSVNADDGPYTDVTGAINSNPGGMVQLRMGAEVPVPAMAMPVVEGKPLPTAGPVQYRKIGTDIDSSARILGDGRFSVYLSIEDTSVYADGQTAPGLARLNDIPTFRTFRSSTKLVLKDGESTQFTAATDKVSGETTRIDVTLTVMK